MEFNIRISEKEHQYFFNNDNNVDYEEFLYTVQKRLSRIQLWRIYLALIVVLIIIIELILGVDELFSLLKAGIIPCLILLPFVIVFDVKRRKIKIEYHISKSCNKRLKNFYDAFFSLNDSDKIWLVYSEDTHNDGKRHAGASTSVRRHEILIGCKFSRRLIFNIDIPTITAGKKSVMFLPDVIWIVSESSIEPVYYSNLELESSTSNFRETNADDLPGDSELVGETWKYVNADGGPDRRFNDNYRVPIFRYSEFEMYDSDDFYLGLLISNYDIGDKFAEKLKTYAKSVIVFNCTDDGEDNGEEDGEDEDEDEEEDGQDEEDGDENDN